MQEATTANETTTEPNSTYPEVTLSEVTTDTDLINQISDLGFGTLTKLQAQALPLLLNGSDVILEGARRGRSLAFAIALAIQTKKDDKSRTYVMTDSEGDAERLSIVLSNLVANAVRHTRASGSVTLLARVDGARVLLSVRDTGEGIAESEQKRIFERAVSLGDRVASDRHGLGLAIAREIAVQHGGEITVRSEPGAGSEFLVSLPRG